MKFSLRTMLLFFLAAAMILGCFTVEPPSDFAVGGPFATWVICVGRYSMSFAALCAVGASIAYDNVPTFGAAALGAMCVGFGGLVLLEFFAS